MVEIDYYSTVFPGFSVGQHAFLNDRLVECQGTVPECFRLWGEPTGLTDESLLPLLLKATSKASVFIIPPQQQQLGGKEVIQGSTTSMLGERAHKAFNQRLQAEN